MHSVILFFWIFWTIFGSESDALICYMCPRTDGQSQVDANIECLALGWELSCGPTQDRCFSTTYADTTEVQKGCTQSQECLGSASCCQGDYCNADPQNSKTGLGKPCNRLSDCVQGSDVMRCDYERLGDTERSCLCTHNSYQRGATCKRKSYPDGPCSLTSHCLDVNTTCVGRTCRCDAGMFPNNTRCDYQRRLGEPCLLHKECRGLNTECTGINCACAFGFLVLNGTDSCSGSTRTTSSSTCVCLTLVLLLTGSLFI